MTTRGRPGTAPSWEAKDLAIVQGLGYAQGTQQHFRDIETAFTGCEGQEFSNEGWVTRALARRAPGDAIEDALLHLTEPQR